MSENDTTSPRHLSVENIASTEDGDHPVHRLAFSDVGSYLDVVIQRGADAHTGPDELPVLRVSYVRSMIRGDMRRMMDELVTQTGIDHARFMRPLPDGASLSLAEMAGVPEERRRPLTEALSGYERSIERLPDPNSEAADGCSDIESFDLTWRTDRDE